MSTLGKGPSCIVICIHHDNVMLSATENSVVCTAELSDCRSLATQLPVKPEGTNVDGRTLLVLLSSRPGADIRMCKI